MSLKTWSSVPRTFLYVSTLVLDCKYALHLLLVKGATFQHLGAKLQKCSSPNFSTLQHFLNFQSLPKIQNKNMKRPLWRHLLWLSERLRIISLFNLKLLGAPTLIRIKASQTNQTCRILTIIVGEQFPIDLRMLKSFRCLRPLKMVSKVPSKLKICDEAEYIMDHKAIFTPAGHRN